MADKAFASLSSGLLARKGAAKPAMRPQGFGSFGSSLEDLGWNDMGHPPEEHVPTPITGLTPAPHVRAEEPPVREQQRVIAETFAEAEPISEPAPEPAPVVQLPTRRAAAPAAAPAKSKTAFTLRLDPERHFKLRLACALTGSSAQQLVTGALDDFLQTLPQLDALSEHAPAEAQHGR